MEVGRCPGYRVIQGSQRALRLSFYFSRMGLCSQELQRAGPRARHPGCDGSLGTAGSGNGAKELRGTGGRAREGELSLSLQRHLLTVC